MKIPSNFPNTKMTQRGTIYDVDSVKRPGIWASDFVTGAFHMSLKHDDPTYRDLLERKFIRKGYMEL